MLSTPYSQVDLFSRQDARAAQRSYHSQGESLNMYPFNDFGGGANSQRTDIFQCQP